MKVTESKLKGCFIIEPQIFEDGRGQFFESYNKQQFEETIGQKVDFVQDNQSISKRGVLRGLHFQEYPNAQAKLVRVIRGEVLDVIVDIRKESATFGNHFKLKLSGNNQKMIFIPKGMAHGFITLSDEAIFAYKCDAYYDKASENGILYNDATLQIDWEFPENEIILSDKDHELSSFKSLLHD